MSFNVNFVVVGGKITLDETKNNFTETMPDGDYTISGHKNEGTGYNSGDSITVVSPYLIATAGARS